MTRHPCTNPDCTYCDSLTARAEVDRDYPEPYEPRWDNQ